MCYRRIQWRHLELGFTRDCFLFLSLWSLLQVSGAGVLMWSLGTKCVFKSSKDLYICSLCICTIWSEHAYFMYLRGLDTLPDILPFLGRQFLWLFAFLPISQFPLEKGSTLKEKNLLSIWDISFWTRSFSVGRQKNSDNELAVKLQIQKYK